MLRTGFEDRKLVGAKSAFLHRRPKAADEAARCAVGRLLARLPASLFGGLTPRLAAG